MVITLKRPLFVKSFTTIDGRNVNVPIAYGSGLVLEKVSNVIIHGMQIHDFRSQPGGAMEKLVGADGDAIRHVSSSKIWIDHNRLYKSEDGLLDVTRGSTEVTSRISWVGNLWNWKSIGDMFENRARFKQSGRRIRPGYNKQQYFRAESANRIRMLTKDAGALFCSTRTRC
ncbi:hypothetical protein LUZ60_012059 [Juncus effusus]|nr:hypothetical protein LUZ60_012059 [Juncus effusus]